MTRRRALMLLAATVIVGLAVFLLGMRPSASGYELAGTWYASGDVPWIAQYEAANPNYGTCVVEMGGQPIARGVWERQAKDTYTYVLMANVPGQCTAIERGTIKITDPETMEATSVLEIYGYGQDPFASQPLFAQPAETHIAKRLVVR